MQAGGPRFEGTHLLVVSRLALPIGLLLLGDGRLSARFLSRCHSPGAVASRLSRCLRSHRLLRPCLRSL